MLQGTAELNHEWLNGFLWKVQLTLYLEMSWYGKKCLTHKIISLAKSIMLVRLRKRINNRKKHKKEKSNFHTLDFTGLHMDGSECSVPGTQQNKLHCVHKKLIRVKCALLLFCLLLLNFILTPTFPAPTPTSLNSQEPHSCGVVLVLYIHHIVGVQ